MHFLLLSFKSITTYCLLENKSRDKTKNSRNIEKNM